MDTDGASSTIGREKQTPLFSGFSLASAASWTIIVDVRPTDPSIWRRESLASRLVNRRESLHVVFRDRARSRRTIATRHSVQLCVSIDPRPSGASPGMDVSGADVYDEEEDANDQPVDYSKKYVERNAPPQTHLVAEGSRTSRAAPSKKELRDSKVDLFYAETDLDQPTDYSLRYAEDDTDDEGKQGAEYFPGGEQEDTVKTYCTEGTPYETPFNFSTATSMSDLRVEDAKESEPLKKVPKGTREIDRKNPVVSFIEQAAATRLGSCDDELRDGLVTKELEEAESPKDSAVLNPGQVTPEKMVSYYEEGTSQGFSRANSPISSLSGAMTTQDNRIPEVLMSKVDSPDSANKGELEDSGHGVLGLNGNQVGLPSESNSLPSNKNNPRMLDKEGLY